METTAKGKLTVEARGEREIVMTRTVDAPRRLVFEAFTKPELLKRWLLGPEGWSMPVCEVDLRVGGRYRYLWRQEATGAEMGMGGVFREIVPPQKLVSTEEFDQPWYPGKGVGTILLTEENGRTKITQTIRYDSREARDGVLRSPMESGVETSYVRLEKMLAG
ncbi:MAG TPA: SRPBCC family protein [Thermoanaerobaculia bacterium]